MIYLLDVNVLYVFHQPRHADFQRVSRWLERHSPLSFATCPMTQAGMLRLLMQRNQGFDRYEMHEAREALRSLVDRRGQEYWPDEPSNLDAASSLFKRMQGHRQITDAYLLGLAKHHGGKLATLDQAIPSLAGPELAESVELIG